LAEDGVRPDSRVLAETSGFAFERKSLFEIEYDDGRSGKFEQEIAESADGDDVSDLAFFTRVDVRMPLFNLGVGICLEAVEQVVGLYPEAFSSAHLDKAAGSILLRKGEAQFFG